MSYAIALPGAPRGALAQASGQVAGGGWVTASPLAGIQPQPRGACVSVADTAEGRCSSEECWARCTWPAALKAAALAHEALGQHSEAALLMAQASAMRTMTQHCFRNLAFQPYEDLQLAYPIQGALFLLDPPHTHPSLASIKLSSAAVTGRGGV